VSVWKNSNDLGKRAAEIAVALATGTAMDAVPEAQKWAGGEKGVEMNAIFLAPTPITADNLNLAIDAGQISKEQACEGAMDTVAACQ
jgi:D-xylose transport system substrate-binding protein